MYRFILLISFLAVLTGRLTLAQEVACKGIACPEIQAMLENSTYLSTYASLERQANARGLKIKTSGYFVFSFASYSLASIGILIEVHHGQWERLGQFVSKIIYDQQRDPVVESSFYSPQAAFPEI